MSSTNRGADRDPTDHYATPLDLSKVIMRFTKEQYIEQPESILVPGSGGGSFVVAAHDVFPDAHTIEGVEIQPDLHGLARKKDLYIYKQNFLTFKSQSHTKYDLIIGNPPFKLAEKFIKKSLSLLSNDGFLIFLLRLTFFGTQNRYKRMWKGNKYRPLEIRTLVKRPQFLVRGSDSDEYCIAMWKRVYNEKIRFDYLDNRETSSKWTQEEYDTYMLKGE